MQAFKPAGRRGRTRDDSHRERTGNQISNLRASGRHPPRSGLSLAIASDWAAA